MGYIAIAIVGSLCGLFLETHLNVLMFPPPYSLLLNEGVVRSFDAKNGTITVEGAPVYPGSESKPLLLVHYNANTSWYRLTYEETAGTISGARVETSAPGALAAGSTVAFWWRQRNAREINAEDIVYEVPATL
jgi:hypothetical protein